MAIGKGDPIVKSVPDQPERTCGESEDLIRVV
jgi:hypothetical protein